MIIYMTLGPSIAPLKLARSSISMSDSDNPVSRGSRVGSFDVTEKHSLLFVCKIGLTCFVLHGKRFHDDAVKVYRL